MVSGISKTHSRNNKTTKLKTEKLRDFVSSWQNVMKTFKIIMDKVLEAGALLSLLGMISVVTVQVVARFALPKAPPWTEEAARIFFVYTVAFAGGLAVKANAFVYVDTFVNMLPKKVQLIIKMCIHLIIVAFMGIIAYHSTTYIQVGSIQLSPVLRIRMSYVFASTFIVSFFIGIYSAIECGKTFLSLKGSKE
jgi:TRAP-type C4-dicarboxylate transport system permease small subunit